MDILIAEPDRLVRHMLRAGIEHLGHRVREAGDVATLRAEYGHHPQLVLVDATLAAATAAADPVLPGGTTPVVLLAAATEVAAGGGPLCDAAVDLLVKPVDPGLLRMRLKLIEELLTLRKRVVRSPEREPCDDAERAVFRGIISTAELAIRGDRAARRKCVADIHATAAWLANCEANGPPRAAVGRETTGVPDVRSRSEDCGGIESHPSPPRALLVTENQVGRRVMQRLLEERGYFVEIVARDALKARCQRATAADVALVDVGRGDHDLLTAPMEPGREAGTDRPPVRIVALSAFRTPELEQQCRDAGVELLEFPVAPPDLDAVLDRLESPQRAAAPEVDPLFDVEAALAIVGGDRDLLGEMAAVFLQNCPRQIEEINEAIAAADGSALARAAHALKGSLVALAARQSGDVAQQLEAWGRADDFAEVDTAWLRLMGQVDSLQCELEAFLAESSSSEMAASI